MRYTIILPPQTALSDVFWVSEWRKEIGEMIGEGEPLVALRAGGRDGDEIIFPSPAFGILTKKLALPGAAIETGEPLAVLSGVPDPLLRPQEALPDQFSACPPYVLGGQEDLIRLSPRDRAIVTHQARSLHNTPHSSTVARVDVTETMRLVDRLTGADLLPFVLCAVAHALQTFPALNAERVNDEAIRRKHYVHLGFPVHDTKTNALIAVPVVRDADKKSVRVVVQEWEEMTRAAHAQTLSFDAQRDATFTLTQSTPGISYQTPIIAPPQAAALCVGRASRIPTVVGESEHVTIRSVLYLCLSHDVRLADHQTAGAFLADVKANLEETRFLFAG